MKHFRLAKHYLLTYFLISCINCGVIWAMYSFNTTPEFLVAMISFLLLAIIEAAVFMPIMPWGLQQNE